MAKQADKQNRIGKGDQAPDFTLPDENGNQVSLADLKGKQVVLYFYPKDDTPGCTQEGKDFKDKHAEFEAANAVILGVSKDDAKSHQKFINKYEFPFSLLSDTDGAMLEGYGVWVEKNMYGKKYMGIERTTFVIDENGSIKEAWRKVKVAGHVDQVLEVVRG